MFCIEVEFEMDGFVIDVENMNIIPPNSLLVLVPHFANVVDPSIPADFVDDNIFYFTVKNCQYVYTFMNLFNHKTSLQEQIGTNSDYGIGAKRKAIQACRILLTLAAILGLLTEIIPTVPSNLT
jgi:hypothetical protein